MRLTLIQLCKETSGLSRCFLQAEGCSHIVRFVEALQQGTDSWLVFLDEGLSLHHLMYAPDGGCRAAAGMPADQQGPSDR